MDILSTRIPTVVVALDEEQYLRSEILTRYCPWTRIVTLDATVDVWKSAWNDVKNINFREHVDVDVNGSSKTCSIIAKATFS